MVNRQTVAAAACAVVAVVGMGLPWVYSGHVARSSFQLLGLIDRLGFAPNGPLRYAIKWWPMVPLLLTVAVMLMFWRRYRSGATVGLLASLYVGAFAGVIRLAVPASSTVRIGVGPLIALGGSLGGTATCIWLLLRRPVDPQPALAEHLT